MPNPLIGVVYHWLGGFAAASFYVPYRGIRRWSWEIFWLTGGVFSWLLAPWLFAGLMTVDPIGVIAAAPPMTIVWCIVFGMLWGFGGLTYGLTMRYLGLSLGMAVVLGLCTVFGTLIPPIFQGDFRSKLVDTLAGNINLIGLAVTVLGIVVVALAGGAKDRALTDAQKTAAVAEFAFRKGIAVAIFSGIMSSCFAFGLAAGEPIKALSAAHGTGPLWTGLPVLCLVMFGGLLTNAAWCAILIVRNRSAGQWFGAMAADGDPAAQSSGPATPAVEQPARLRHVGEHPGRAPLAANYLLSAVGGTLWYFQFFFYTMGESQMGRFGFSSWTVHMASIIIFGTAWGFGLREWRDATPRVRVVVWSGAALLIFASIIIGYGNKIGA